MRFLGVIGVCSLLACGPARAPVRAPAADPTSSPAPAATGAAQVAAAPPDPAVALATDAAPATAEVPAVDASTTPADRLRALVARCSAPGFAVDSVAALPDGIEFELTERDRTEIARAVRDYSVALYGKREGKLERSVFDAWIAAGAAMEVLQAVRTVDTDRRSRGRLDRVVVLAYDHARWGRQVAFVGHAPKARAWFTLVTGGEAGARAIALADRDRDGWPDVLLLRPLRERAMDLLWSTSRPGEEVRWAGNERGGQEEVGRRDHLLLGFEPTCR